ncbi:MAG: TonB-dependent receptor [Pseudomonadota bacterium]
MTNKDKILRYTRLTAAVMAAIGSCYPTGTLAQPSGPALEEVIVTASRREQSIQDSSQVIEAFSSEKLFQEGTTSMVGVGELMPSLQVSLAGPQLQVYIRGVGTPTATIVGSPAISLNKDGIYIARSQAAGPSFFDLERVEVVKGPQGTLYGRNATGGAVNLLTKQPMLDETEGFISTDIGNHDLVQFEGAINVPLGDTVAMRASAFSIDRDGYMSDGTMDDDHWAVRLQTLWEPNEDMSLTVRGQYADYGGKGLGGFSYGGADDPWDSIYPGANEILDEVVVENGFAVPSIIFPWLTDAPVLGPAPSPPFPPGTNIISITDFYGDNAYQDISMWDVNATFIWDLDFATLTVLPSYQEMDSQFQNSPGVVWFELRNPFNGDGETSKAATLEIRLSGETDNFQWVGGVNFFHEKNVGPTRLNQGAVQNLFVDNTFETDAFGIFGEAVYSWNDTTRFIAGLRYSFDNIDKPDFVRWSMDQATDCPPDAPNRQTINGVVACQISPKEDESVDFQKVNYKVGIEYDVAEDSMVYFTVSTGYKAGGLSAVSGAEYDPEELTAFELGTKNLFMDGRLQFNGDIFYWEYDDRQENNVGPDDLGIIGQATINAGSATLQGVGFDMVFAATDNDRFRLGVEYLDGEYDDFVYEQGARFTPPTTACPITDTGKIIPAPGVPPFTELLRIDCSGFETTRSPKWTGNASYTHTIELGDYGLVDANVSATYKDEVWSTSNFLEPYQRVPDLWVVNASLNYMSADDTYQVIAYVDNINDEGTFGAGLNNTQNYQVVGLAPTPPRTYGVRLKYNF